MNPINRQRRWQINPPRILTAGVTTGAAMFSPPDSEPSPIIAPSCAIEHRTNLLMQLGGIITLSGKNKGKVSSIWVKTWLNADPIHPFTWWNMLIPLYSCGKTWTLDCSSSRFLDFASFAFLLKVFHRKQEEYGWTAAYLLCSVSKTWAPRSSIGQAWVLSVCHVCYPQLWDLKADSARRKMGDNKALVNGIAMFRKIHMDHV